MAAAKGKSGGTRKPAAKPAAAKTQTIKSPGKTPVTFEKGGLHKSLGVPQGQPIPAAKMQAALAGKAGPKARQQAEFAQNMLKAGRKTAAKNRSKGK
jgi:hypothetical protein